MPAAFDLEKDRKHPLQALGDAELLASCEEKRAEKYSVVAAWHACIAVIQRRIAVCTAAAWLQLGHESARIAASAVATSPATPAVHSSKSSRKFGRCEEKVDLAGRANGHPILRAAEGDTSQLVTAYSLKEIMESVMVDQLTALGASAWVTHLHLSGKRWSVSATQAIKIENGKAIKVPWFWHWAEARAREATAGQLRGSGVMRIRSATELVGSTDFDPLSLSFSWLAWLARLGLLVAGKHDPAGAQMLAMVWSGVNRAYLAAEKDVHKMYRHTAVFAGSAHVVEPMLSTPKGRTSEGASAGGSGAKRTGPSLGSQAKRTVRTRCSKCLKWHAPEAGCKVSESS
jgi:hypothetical protein